MPQYFSTVKKYKFDCFCDFLWTLWDLEPVYKAQPEFDGTNYEINI
jgi:hypothetical protein